ncbi:hypothetical protein NCAS_0F01020 [Naumovozyma castellii]|uniref:Uncharacterized protein n=1 Tax=Naumovozyma castellii TaxID=27288 RepID=G0VGG5_NAUCA|nr:hypothetical protein NCAS_0F01020 [Naumovozyma castellii CBS 4309]CCC70586.1 hypothetical protein NCAS_0F01020 [Naumovozyma castellii CBS 4309]
MAKKEKKGGKAGQRITEDGIILVDPPRDVANKEKLQRMSYLYQLSTWTTMTNLSDDSQSIARLYARDIDLISKKSKISMLPTVKRSLCKKCHRVLIPSVTVRSEIRNLSQHNKKLNKNNDVMELICNCGQIKRFPIGLNRNYKTHSEKDDVLTTISTINKDSSDSIHYRE